MGGDDGEGERRHPGRNLRQVAEDLVRVRHGVASRGVHGDDVVAHGLPQVGEGLGDREAPYHQEAGRGVVRLDEDVQGASAEAGHRYLLDPLRNGPRARVRGQADQARGAVHQCPRRLPDDGRLGAAPADPSVHGAVEGDDGPIPRLARRRALRAHHERGGEGDARGPELAGPSGRTRRTCTSLPGRGRPPRRPAPCHRIHPALNRRSPPRPAGPSTPAPAWPGCRCASPPGARGRPPRRWRWPAARPRWATRPRPWRPAGGGATA